MQLIKTFFSDKKIRITCVVSFVHFVLSFWTDRFYFDYGLTSGANELFRVLAFKGLFFAVLLVIWYQIFALATRISEKKANMTWLKCTAGYLIILLLFNAAVWPGLWEWDEYYVLNSATGLHIHVWQSLLSNVLYIISMMLIPFPTGVIIVQIIIVSIIVGYVLSFIFEEFHPNTL